MGQLVNKTWNLYSVPNRNNKMGVFAEKDLKGGIIAEEGLVRGGI